MGLPVTAFKNFNKWTLVHTNTTEDEKVYTLNKC